MQKWIGAYLLVHVPYACLCVCVCVCVRERERERERKREREKERQKEIWSGGGCIGMEQEGPTSP